MAKGRYHHGDLRNALMDAAEVLVRERGVEGWSLREVSVQVGVSPSAAYHHFASREALVRALSARVLTRFGRRLAAACARARGQADDPYRRLVAYSRTYVGWVVEDPAVARLVFSTGSSESEPAADPHPHDVLAAELDRLMESGRLAEGARPGAEFVVWAAVHGFAALLLDGLARIRGRRAAGAHAERVVRTVLHGLTAGDGVAAPAPAGTLELSSAYTDRRARERAGQKAHDQPLTGTSAGQSSAPRGHPARGMRAAGAGPS